MARKAIQTNQAVVACDVCGRTLLRGENADLFLHGGSRKTVCELCTSRAIHEGWIREGLDSALGRSGDRSGARSLLGRLRSRRVERGQDEPVEEPLEAEPVYHPATYDPEYYDPAAVVELGDAIEQPATIDEFPLPEPSAPVQHVAPPVDTRPREPRHVAAVPTNAERKVTRALEVFNSSPHTRTVAGVARSLGAPMVAARPSETEGSVVTIVVGWELSWYRYELDLADEAAGVRLTGQGGELEELAAEDQSANATADDHGELHPLAAVA